MYLNGIDQQNPGFSGYKKMTARFSGRAKERFWELDFFRGVCVSLMIFDHFMYCLWDVLPFINRMLGTKLFAAAEAIGRAYWTWDVRTAVWRLVICAFFILCGISCTLTRGNFRRAVLLALVAAGITEVTSLVERFGMSNATVLFGVIHMLACGVFLYAFLDNAALAVGDMLGTGKVSRFFKEALRCLPGLVGIGLLIFYFVYCADLVYASGTWELVSTLPARDTVEANLFLSAFAEVKNFDFYRYSGDYFPILPYALLVLIGGIIGKLVYHTRAKYAFAPLDGVWNSGVCFLGRHAAFIYVAHMVVIPCLFGAAAFISSLF